MTTPHRAHPAARSRRAVASAAGFLGLGITLACTTESGTTGTSDDGSVVTVESTQSDAPSATDTATSDDSTATSDDSTATSDDWTATPPGDGASSGPSHGSSGGS